MDTNKRDEIDIPSELFRPSKRRKFYRKRSSGTDDAPTETASPRSITSPQLRVVDELLSQDGRASMPQSQSADNTSLPPADIVRQRKAAQRRRGGIEFTNSALPDPKTSQLSDALIEKEGDLPVDIKAVVSRFEPQTGQIADTTNDKHMMAYIDSELAKRNLQSRSTLTNPGTGQELSSSGALLNADVRRQPAALGKLHEIDLGPDATLRNIALTEAAHRRLEGIEPEINQKTGKVRLRKNGKPYGRRKRRNSEDIKRDELVEEVMRESKLDIYDEPDNEEAEEGDQAADDRIAEQFRKEFLEAVSSRQQKAIPKPAKAKGAAEELRGPKLGGSRSARAKMREMEEAANKKK